MVAAPDNTRNDGQAFERLVELIERSIQGPGATIRRNVKVPELATGSLRQVDVWITIPSGHAESTIAAEAKDYSLPLNITIMEQTIAKHEKLGTGLLVIYCRSGFSEQALEAARLARVIPISPSDLQSGDAAKMVAHALSTVWLKLLGAVPTGCTLFFTVNDQEVELKAPSDHPLCDPDGVHVATALQVAQALISAYLDQHHLELVRHAEASTQRTAQLSTGEAPECYLDGKKIELHSHLLVQEGNQDPTIRLESVIRVEVTFELTQKVSSVGLNHNRLVRQLSVTEPMMTTLLSQLFR